MGKIVATFLVKVTLREPDLFDPPKGGADMYPPDPREIPLVPDVASRIEAALAYLPFDANATAERTDR